MSEIKWGEKRYYKNFKDDSFMHTVVFSKKRIGNDYRYLPRFNFVKTIQFLFYYLIAFPILFLFGKIIYGVNVKGRKKLKKIKGGYILVGNHVHPMDCSFVSVFVAFPRRNYFICNKDAVQVVFGKYFTKALGALPLPDDKKGLVNLNDAVKKILKKGKCVTIYPEACIWPYYTKLRPLGSASFHYAVSAKVPVVPFAVTFRYAKGKNKFRKKPKVNIEICDPIYPNQNLSSVDAKRDIMTRTESSLKKVIETEGNVAFYKYLPKE